MMDTSIFLAQVFSIYFVVIGAAIILRRSWYQEVFTTLFECKHCLFIVGLLTLIIGILLVVAHPAFTNDWRSIITVLAWLSLLKGLFYLFLPKLLISYQRAILSHPVLFYIMGPVVILFGLYLGYLGFFI